MSEQNKQKLAADKLAEELKNAKEKDFAEPIIEYLIQRVNDDEGFAEDVLKETKVWSKCFSFIYEQAKKLAGSKKAIGVRNDMVFEWAEDYFRKEDKDLASAKPKAKSKATKMPTNVKPTSGVTKIVDNVDKSVEKVTDTVIEKKPKKQKPKKEDMSGQMSIFDLFGGLDG